MGDGTKKIETIHNKTIGTEHLIEVASDPKLKDYYIVCFWEDDTASSGHSSGISNGDMAYAMARVQQDARAFEF